MGFVQSKLRKVHQWLPLELVSLLCLAFAPAVPFLHAQRDYAPRDSSSSVNVGGKWWEFDSEDRMTAARKATFTITSDSYLRSDQSAQSRVDIYCENGKFKHSEFTPGVSLGPPTHPGFWGQPQMEVLVRVNDKHSNHGWNWNGRSLSMDKGTTRELMGAQIFRIEFLARGGQEIAEFSPIGLDFSRIAHGCDLTPKKP